MYTGNNVHLPRTETEEQITEVAYVMDGVKRE